MVRAKALQTMADVTATASENEVVADVIKNLFDPDRPNDNRYVRSPKNTYLPRCHFCSNTKDKIQHWVLRLIFLPFSIF